MLKKDNAKNVDASNVNVKNVNTSKVNPNETHNCAKEGTPPKENNNNEGNMDEMRIRGIPKGP